MWVATCWSELFFRTQCHHFGQKVAVSPTGWLQPPQNTEEEVTTLASRERALFLSPLCKSSNYQLSNSNVQCSFYDHKALGGVSSQACSEQVR